MKVKDFSVHMILIGAVVLTICLQPMPAQAVYTFQSLGDLSGGSFESKAYGVSADGSVVVGYGTNSSYSEAFRWTASGGMVGLGFLEPPPPFPFGYNSSVAYGVSADGSVVVGGSSSSSGQQPFRWTASGGMEGLGFSGTFTGPDNAAYGTSADGSVVIVTLGDLGHGHRSFIWTATGGMVDLGIAIGDYGLKAAGISADGTVVVGYSHNAEFVKPFRWTQSEGLVELPAHVGSTAISADGKVIVGGNSRWSEADGVVTLGNLPGGHFEATGTSGDGSVIVGRAGGEFDGEWISEPFIWDATHGMQSLKAFLENEGVDLSGWTLQEATGISADGRSIVGYGINPGGKIEAWRASAVPIPSAILLVGAGLGRLAIYRRRKMNAQN